MFLNGSTSLQPRDKHLVRSYNTAPEWPLFGSGTVCWMQQHLACSIQYVQPLLVTVLGYGISSTAYLYCPPTTSVNKPKDCRKSFSIYIYFILVAQLLISVQLTSDSFDPDVLRATYFQSPLAFHPAPKKSLLGLEVGVSHWVAIHLMLNIR